MPAATPAAKPLRTMSAAMLPFKGLAVYSRVPACRFATQYRPQPAGTRETAKLFAPVALEPSLCCPDKLDRWCRERLAIKGSLNRDTNLCGVNRFVGAALLCQGNGEICVAFQRATVPGHDYRHSLRDLAPGSSVKPVMG